MINWDFYIFDSWWHGPKYNHGFESDVDSEELRGMIYKDFSYLSWVLVYGIGLYVDVSIDVHYEYNIN